ncbi:serine/threonine protein kinase [Actinomadura barringtoniae]|uniref:non-specific serine/threonine protein kinase n=1 Tax=Actinomadura barringtoniae TaxID=1427535 RepID=A0A939PQU9_9ACTN|nr:serine/threonine-protein kinase [Actinomadura barringtoniae]MBO2454563.1 serine/threonine protein kinase [Actinomadura barringtoniae]
MTSATGWQVPGYTELQELGAGAQGRVVLARGNVTGEVVAIKYLAADLVGDSRTLARFQSEAEMLARVVNPHVTQLREYVTLPGGAAIVMEAVHGQSLRKLLDDRQRLQPEAALAILKGSLLGMAAAHSVGVIHRDYKPANVMVQDHGQSKLIDFGVAVLRGDASMMGTPAYMAPEQWQGGPASPATDIYSATCVLFECVTGGRPFSADTIEGWTTQHTSANVPLERLQEPLRPLVIHGMAKHPTQRFSNANDFVRALEAVAASAYGADWERRGWAALGGMVALFAAAFPLTLLGGGIAGTGTATGTAAATAAGAVGSAPPAAAGHSGLIGKVGGSKVIVGAGTAVTGAAIAAYLLWPSPPTVGGKASGSVHAYFTQPGVLLGQPNMPATDTPFMKMGVEVTPARVKPGTTIKVVTRFQAKTFHGVKYLPGGVQQCFGQNTKRQDTNNTYGFRLGGPESKQDNVERIYFFRTPKSGTPPLPTKPTGTYVAAPRRLTYNNQPYLPSQCAYSSTWVDEHTFKMPDTDELKPGYYLIAPFSAAIFTGSKKGVDLSPQESGARIEGQLPRIRVFWD